MKLRSARLLTPEEFEAAIVYLPTRAPGNSRAILHEFFVAGMRARRIAEMHECTVQNVVNILGRFQTAFQRYSDVVRNMGGEPPAALDGAGSNTGKPAKKTKLYLADEALASIVGSAPLERLEALKLVWAYIREHDLQKADDKRVIVADAWLRALFGADEVPMQQVLGMLSLHLTLTDATDPAPGEHAPG